MNNKSSTSSNYIRAILMILTAAFCFSWMTVFVRLSGDLPSAEKSFFRNLVAAFFAAGILYRKKIPLSVPKNCYGPMFLRCFFGTLGILANFYAIDHLLLADANILNKLSPFFAVIFSFFFLKEKVSLTQILCLILAFAGCLFIVKPGFVNAPVIPALTGLFGGASAGLAYTMVRKMGTRGVKGPVIVFCFSAFSCLSVIPLFAVQFVMPQPKQLFMLIMAGLAAAGGQFSITAAYTYAPARKISIYDYSQILFSTLFGFLLFREIPDGCSFIGYILIIAASFFMFLYNRSRE